LLFLLMKPGAKFTEELVGKVKSAISQDVGRRCVPKYVFETPEIPVSFDFLVPSPFLSCKCTLADDSVHCRRLSTSKKSSCPSSRLCRARSSSPRTRWPTRSACSSTISLRKWKSWSQGTTRLSSRSFERIVRADLSRICIRFDGSITSSSNILFVVFVSSGIDDTGKEVNCYLMKRGVDWWQQ